jgi:hypothetical protein
MRRRAMIIIMPIERGKATIARGVMQSEVYHDRVTTMAAK